MDLTESKYLNYALPDMKDGIACIPVSGELIQPISPFCFTRCFRKLNFDAIHGYGYIGKSGRRP